MDISPERGSEAGVSHATDATDNVKAPEDLSTDEVRQGVTGHGVRYVLMISLATSLVALAVAWVLVV
jgi:hypothetical protein